MMKREDKNHEKRREKEIEKLVGKMTLDEKLAMIHGAALFASGAVERLEIPAIVCSDGPMGGQPSGAAPCRTRHSQCIPPASCGRIVL